MVLDLLLQSEAQAGLRAFLPALICVALASLTGLSVSIGLAWRMRAIAETTPKQQPASAEPAEHKADEP
ncbi:hypothetical protein [Kallotenue papyrolyticum]|uniref:hypothetical protein n=1 Tax=Kallotenue papyrolyticum TaxID=1325125 RepID=UPI00047853F8|nr:hypothetical protein [Kallotenue papyrolyticum]